MTMTCPGGHWALKDSVWQNSFPPGKKKKQEDYFSKKTETESLMARDNSAPLMVCMNRLLNSWGISSYFQLGISGKVGTVGKHHIKSSVGAAF
jgi:hypothetical protein